MAHLAAYKARQGPEKFLSGLIASLRFMKAVECRIGAGLPRKTFGVCDDDGIEAGSDVPAFFIGTI
jgi:hypothetical protein